MATREAAAKQKPLGAEFVIAALAGIGTAFLTNPADVLKTRLQLQGELAAAGSYEKLYRNTFHAAYLMARQEGIVALQSGLMPVFGLQVIINTLRLGSYHFAKRHKLNLNEKDETHILKTAVLSGASGTMGVVIGNPLYLAKVKLQAHARSTLDREYSCAWRILRSLWREGGFRSFYREWNANVPRLFIGSAVQLTVYGVVTDYLKPTDTFAERPMLTAFAASVVGGTCVVFSVHPLDVMSTRLYNQETTGQGKGALYRGIIDGLSKTVRAEGLSGLYKGTFANWLRLAPYVVICQLLYEKIALLYDSVREEGC